jgi:large subunit ribosomal protein L29
MKTEELREMPEVELQARNRELRADLFHMNLHNSLDKLEKPHRIRQLRKDIARVETLLNSKPADLAANQIFTACKSTSTNEQAITEVVSQIKSLEEWNHVREAFRARHSDFHEGNLIQCLKQELSPNEKWKVLIDPLRERGIEILGLSKVDEAADRIFTACEGVGTDEEGIRRAMRMLESRWDWMATVRAFRQRHGDFNDGDLMKCLDQELSAAEMTEYVVEPLRVNGIEIQEKPAEQTEATVSE